MEASELRNKVPEHTIGGLDRWVNSGIPTGDFLHAVLTHELFEAFGRADEINRAAMFDIVSYIYCELPISCHGNPKKVAEWQTHNGLEGPKEGGRNAIHKGSPENA